MDQVVEILNKVGFDWRLALANFVNFLIVFWVLKRYFFGPLKELSDARIAREKKAASDADAAANDRASAQATREREIARAKEEAEGILATAREQANRFEERARHKVLELRDETLKKAQNDIDREREELRAQVRKETGELVARGMRHAFAHTMESAEKERVTKSLVSGN